jgi:hypothetical protein
LVAGSDGGPPIHHWILGDGMARALSGLLVSGAALLAFTPALAQEQQAQQAQQAGQGMFARDRNVSVTQRNHPGYDPVPVPVGAFIAQPKLDVGLEFNDNIYASQTAKTSDTIVTVNPEVDLASNWNRNSLSAFARSATRDYLKQSSETTTDYQVGGQGRLDVGAGSLSAGGDTGELTEPRTSTQTSNVSTHPIRYQQSDAFIGAVEEFNRIRLTGRIDLADMDYHNGKDTTGASVLEDDRDRTNTVYSGKAEFALSPDTAIFVAGSYNDHSYRLTPPSVALDRDSHGSTVVVGANFDLSSLVRGDVQVGYLKQDFASRTFSSISGLSAQGRLEWFPTQLTTVTLTGSRGIQDAAVTGSAAYVAEIGNIQIDHELLRNVILVGRVGVENDAYKGIDRTDNQTNAYVGARYLLNRLIGLNVGYSYLDQKSSGGAPGPKYTVNKFTISTTLAF